MQQRRDEPQVAGDGRLQRQQGQDPLVHLQEPPVEAIVVGDDHLRQLDVLVLERLQRPVELHRDQVERAQRVGLQRRELVPETLA